MYTFKVCFVYFGPFTGLVCLQLPKTQIQYCFAKHVSCVHFNRIFYQQQPFILLLSNPLTVLNIKLHLQIKRAVLWSSGSHIYL